MTAHRPIRVPSEPSLLERAAAHFDFAASRGPAMPAPLPVETRPNAPSPRWSGETQRIDREHLRTQGFIVPGDSVTALLEELRLVKRQLVLSAAESRAGLRPPRGERILVASAQPGEGKTWIAVNLALAIAAEMDNEVLLVDADFAKPSVLSTLGLAAGPGLMDAIVDPAMRPEDAVIATDILGLAVLPAGRATVSDTEYLASARTAEVLDRLTAQAPNRMIIFDSPPVLAASPAAELAAHVGQTLVVVRADRTGEAEVADALSLLAACKDRKLILNGVQFSPTGRRFGAYYGYSE